MATQVQLQALLGSNCILLLIKNVGPRSLRILQQFCEVTEGLRITMVGYIVCLVVRTHPVNYKELEQPCVIKNVPVLPLPEKK